MTMREHVQMEALPLCRNALKSGSVTVSMQSVAQIAQTIRGEVSKAIVSQHDLIDQILVAMFANGHVLIEGVPGVAKTLTVRAMAMAMDLQFTRIQFTPDMMPSDVIGTNVFDPRSVEFVLRKGPVFTQILLADEINRTPPKTQSALLEAMEERQSTIDGIRHALPSPFLVFATQNPIEFEGTYPLPEAQQDRFMMKVLVTYPEPEAEKIVLSRFHQGFRAQNLEDAGIQPVVNLETLMQIRQVVQNVTVEDKIIDYLYSLVAATRDHADIQIGASPRAGLAMLSAAKAVAAMRDRNFVIPDDVKELAIPVLRHRVLLRPEVDTQGITVDEVLGDLLGSSLVPR
jgi:MoxR-like ATPase